MKTWFEVSMATKYTHTKMHKKIDKKQFRHYVILKLALMLLCILFTFLAIERWQFKANTINKHAYLLEKQSNSKAREAISMRSNNLQTYQDKPSQHSSISDNNATSKEHLAQKKLRELRMHNVLRTLTKRGNSVAPVNSSATNVTFVTSRIEMLASDSTHIRGE